MRDLQVRASPYPHIIPARCALVSDMWTGKGNMAEEAMGGLQVQGLHYALTFSGICPTHPLQVPQGLAHSTLIGPPTRITSRTQSAVQSLESVRIPARSRGKSLTKEKSMHDLWCISNGCRHVVSRWPSMADTDRSHLPSRPALPIFSSGAGRSTPLMRMSYATVRCLSFW